MPERPKGKPLSISFGGNEGLQEVYENLMGATAANSFDAALGWDLMPGGSRFLDMGSVDMRLWDDRSGADEKLLGVIRALNSYDRDRKAEFVPKLEEHVITHCAAYAASVAAQIYPNNPDLTRRVVSLAFPRIEIDAYGSNGGTRIEFPRLNANGDFVDKRGSQAPGYQPFNILEFSLAEDGRPNRSVMEGEVAKLYQERPEWAKRMAPILDAYFAALEWPSLSYPEGALKELEPFRVGQGFDRNFSISTAQARMLKLLCPHSGGFAQASLHQAEGPIHQVICLLQQLELGETGSRKNFVIAYKIQQALARLQIAVGRNDRGEVHAEKLLGGLLNPNEGAVHFQDVEIPFHKAESPSVQVASGEARVALERGGHV